MHGAAELAVACALLVASGCSSAPQPAIVVTPSSSRGDDPVAIKVTGLPKNAATQIAVTSTDGDGDQWSSQASFTADTSGVVDLSTAASSQGSYLGVSGMGLITSMHTQDASTRPDLAYHAPTRGPSTFRVEAQAAGVHQTATFTRTFLPDPVSSRTLTLARDHVSGTYFSPATPTVRGPAVLLLGGSEGGNSQALLAQTLAARGIPALAVAYFAAPGLPKHLAGIPLEYFRGALTWLEHQPGVEQRRLWVSGGSYGSEAALLLGSRYPDLIHGVLSLSGGNTVTCSLTPGTTTASCDRSPFTSGGKPVPFTRQFDDVSPTDNPAAVIPVEKIRGPVVAVCGGADLEWNACQLSQAVLDRRKSHGVGQHDLLLGYPDAGHYVDFLVANRPINTPPNDPNNGATPQANPQADAAAWPRVVDHLRNY